MAQEDRLGRKELLGMSWRRLMSCENALTNGGIDLGIFQRSGRNEGEQA